MTTTAYLGRTIDHRPAMESSQKELREKNLRVLKKRISEPNVCAYEASWHNQAKRLLRKGTVALLRTLQVCKIPQRASQGHQRSHS